MKKIILILLAIALVFAVPFGMATAHAEENGGGTEAQPGQESVIESESAEESEQGSETITITKDELKHLIDEALTENQKNIISMLSEKISGLTGLDFTSIYLIIAACAVVVLGMIEFIV